MKRTILALAVASLSVAAYSSPPPGGGPPTPIDVNVVNKMPLPVSIAPSWTPVQEGSLLFIAGGDATKIVSVLVQDNVVIKGIDVHVFAKNLASGWCLGEAWIAKNEAGEPHSRLAYFEVPAGSDLTYHYPLPDLFVPDSGTVGDSLPDLYYYAYMACSGNARWTITYSGIRVP